MTILKLIRFEPVSHIVTWPVSRGDPDEPDVGDIDIVAVAVAESEACKVAVSAGVGELATSVGAGVNVAGTMPQNIRSRSPFVAENDGSSSKSTTVSPSGHA